LGSFVLTTKAAAAPVVSIQKPPLTASPSLAFLGLVTVFGKRNKKVYRWPPPKVFVVADSRLPPPRIIGVAGCTAAAFLDSAAAAAVYVHHLIAHSPLKTTVIAAAAARPRET
jgi:hypothetical protein